MWSARRPTATTTTAPRAAATQVRSACAWIASRQRSACLLRPSAAPCPLPRRPAAVRRLPLRLPPALLRPAGCARRRLVLPCVLRRPHAVCGRVPPPPAAAPRAAAVDGQDRRRTRRRRRCPATAAPAAAPAAAAAAGRQPAGAGGAADAADRQHLGRRCQPGRQHALLRPALNFGIPHSQCPKVSNHNKARTDCCCGSALHLRGSYGSGAAVVDSRQARAARRQLSLSSLHNRRVLRHQRQRQSVVQAAQLHEGMK